MFLDLFQPHLCLTQENFTLQCSRTHLPILLIFYFSLPFSSYLTISPYLLFFSYSYTFSPSRPLLLTFSFSLPFSSYLAISPSSPISPSPPLFSSYLTICPSSSISPSPPLFSSYLTISPSSPLSSSFSSPSNPLSTSSSPIHSHFPTLSPSRLFPHHPLLPAVHR